MEWRLAGCETGNGKPNRSNNSSAMRLREGKVMTEMFMHAFFAVRGAHSTLLQRARTERGASMVEYALLVGLIAVVAVVLVAALGNGISGLFGKANTCVAGLNSTACTP
jgi:pilus assembly protein Flp/PilA